jgi:hypothetical protein
MGYTGAYAVYFGREIRKNTHYASTRKDKCGALLDAAYGAIRPKDYKNIKEYDCQATFFLVGFGWQTIMK